MLVAGADAAGADGLVRVRRGFFGGKRRTTTGGAGDAGVAAGPGPVATTTAGCGGVGATGARVVRRARAGWSARRVARICFA